MGEMTHPVGGEAASLSLLSLPVYLSCLYPFNAFVLVSFDASVLSKPSVRSSWVACLAVRWRRLALAGNS